MREIKKKSVIPIYGAAAAWALYCIFCPLYKTSDFLLLACVGFAVYAALSALFPGKKEYVEIPQEPVRTGDERIDALLQEGEKAVAELRDISSVIKNDAAIANGVVVVDDVVKLKLDEIIAVTDKIFKDLLEDPDDYKQIKRFSDFYLPTTIKLMRTYANFTKIGTNGENITETLERITNSLDMIIDSYKRFYDSLYENQALDIETDIRVLENILKKEWL